MGVRCGEASGRPGPTFSREVFSGDSSDVRLRPLGPTYRVPRRDLRFPSVSGLFALAAELKDAEAREHLGRPRRAP